MVAHAPGRVVLSYGMGCESTAILLRWLEDPTSRDFDLSDAIILTVGGVYRLSSELAAAGTTPQVASGRRLCSLKFKGFVLDAWIAGELGGRPFRHVMGFNLAEAARIQRDRSYSTTSRLSEYPLVAWGWDRARCEQYLLDLVGEPWPKSACVYCPFAANHAALPALLARYRRFPDAAVQAMLLELTSMALNPNMALFGSRSVHALVTADGNHAALTSLEAALAVCDYALYEVRRVFPLSSSDPGRPGRAWRSVRELACGTETAVLGELRRRADGAGIAVASNRHVHRAVLRPRGVSAPTKEHVLVVSPGGVQTKQRPGFERVWAQVGDDDVLQPPLGLVQGQRL